MTTPLLASAGLFTAILGAVAASIGAGLVVGGFVAGLISLVKGTPATASEREAVTGGYFGGLVGLFLLTIDTLAKHVV